MAPIENARGYRHGPSCWSSEDQLQKVAILLENDLVQVSDIGRRIEIENNRYIESSGEIVFYQSGKFSSVLPGELGPQVSYTLKKTYNVLAKLGCSTSFSSADNIAHLSIGKHEFAVQCFGRPAGTVVFNHATTVSLAALALVPEPLLDKVGQNGLVVKERLGSVTTLLPGKWLDKKAEQQNILFPTEIFFREPLSVPARRLFSGEIKPVVLIC